MSFHFDNCALWSSKENNCSTWLEFWQTNCSHFAFTSYLCGSLSCWKCHCKVLKNVTFLYGIQTSTFSPSQRPTVVSCEVGTLQGCQTETAADWRDHIYVPVGIMQDMSRAPLQNPSVFTLNIWPLCDTVQHAGEKIYLWWKGDGGKNKLSNTILHII